MLAQRPDVQPITRSGQRTDGRPIAVLLIDPRPLTRDCLAQWLAREDLGVAARALPSSPDPPDPEDAWDLAVIVVGGDPVASRWVANEVARLRSVRPPPPFLLLGHAEGRDEVDRALAMGAAGYVPTSLPLHVVDAVLRLAATGGVVVPPCASPADARGAAGEAPPLTARERDVLRLLSAGKPNKIIAYELNLSESTVKGHVHSILSKLKATNRTEAVFRAGSPRFAV
jgi:DNA-binding NarL/FixJ family response regulator